MLGDKRNQELENISKNNKFQDTNERLRLFKAVLY